MTRAALRFLVVRGASYCWFDVVPKLTCPTPLRIVIFVPIGAESLTRSSRIF